MNDAESLLLKKPELDMESESRKEAAQNRPLISAVAHYFE
jgi:hypothetical protein